MSDCNKSCICCKKQSKVGKIMHLQPDMSLVNLFPTTLYKNKMELKENMRLELVQEIERQRNEDGGNLEDIRKPTHLESYHKPTWTGDWNGHEFLHLQPMFKLLFEGIGTNILNYINLLGLDDNDVKLYFQRCWATLQKNGESVRPHTHNQSHISFAYYLQIQSEDDGQLVIHNQTNPNELAPGIFELHSVNSDSKKEKFNQNYINLKAMEMNVKQGDLIIFPSKTLHSTTPNKTNNNRICISGDVSIIATDSSYSEILVPPIEKWLKIGDNDE